MTDWHRKNEGKLAVGVVAFVVVTLVAVMSLAGGLQASFENSRFDCPDDPSLIFCSKGVADASNNAIDYTENLLTDRTEFDDWTENGTCAVTADQYRNPVDGTMDADYLDNTGGANTDYRQIDTGETADTFHTGSVWVRSDYVHTITIQLYEDGVGEVDHFDFVAGNSWRRIPVDGVSATGGDLLFRVFPGEMGVSTGTAYFYGAQVVANDEYMTGMGIYINPTDQSVSKPRYDLADTNDPVLIKTDLQHQGNKSEGRDYDADFCYYSKAHHDSMNIFDGDWTMTFYITMHEHAGETDNFFSHGAYEVDGCSTYARDTDASVWAVRCSNNGDHMDSSIIVPRDIGDGYWHVVQMVRDNNIVTIYADGVAGTPQDFTGYGVDGDRTFYLGRKESAGEFWQDGAISYTTIRSRALSTDELAEEREEILGTYTNWSQVNAWDFERTTVAYKTFSAGGADALVSHMSEVAVDHPRVAGKGGGMLVEGQSTNMLEYSQQFQQAATWTVTNASVVADSAISLDGTTTTDTLHEDGTAAVQHHIRHVAVATVTDSVYTYSVYSEAINRDWIFLYISADATGSYFNVNTCEVGTLAGGATAKAERMPNGVCRCSTTWTSTTTGNQNPYIYLGEADNDNNFDGLDQDSVYIWNAQVEESPFPTSPILTTTEPVTRTADDMTMDPHETGTNEWVLPLSFTPEGPASKLTVYAEFKCEWSGVADIGGVNRMLMSISGGTGAGERQADHAHNRLAIYVADTGDLEASMDDSDGTSHMMTTVVDPVDYDEWFSVRAFFDFSDFSRMSLWMQQCPGECHASGESDAANAYFNNDSTGNFYTDDTKIRLGQWWNTDINGDCQVRNVRIEPAEVRP